MFLRNRTDLEARLSRAVVDEEISIATVIVSACYSVGAKLTRTSPADVRGLPPDAASCPLWSGVSVTATGHSHAPPQPPFSTPVRLQIERESRQLVVFGHRSWTRRRGELVPSEALPFEPIDVQFAHAFGGFFHEPPGVVPGSDMPHPGGRVEFPENPGGIGFYRDESSAAGMPLPNVERPDCLISHWSDRPRPASFAPCPELPSLRSPAAGAAPAGQRLDDAFFQGEPPGCLLALHHAPRELVFRDIPAGSRTALHGMGHGPLCFQIPAAPAIVSARSTVSTVLPAALRCVHLDADARAVSLTWGFSGYHSPERPPRFFDVHYQP
jgi:uncharacterized protein DUF2169